MCGARFLEGVRSAIRKCFMGYLEIDAMNLSGQCLCGAVKYVCAGEPVISGNCHCRDCQRSSGGAYAPTFFVPEQTISIEGQIRYFDSAGGSGGKVSRGFCPVCGSQLFSKSDSMAGLVAVRAGTLDDTSQYHPQVDIFVSHAPTWDFIAPGSTQFPEMPPKPGA